MSDTAARLAELGIELPDPPAALGAYVPYVLAGDLDVEAAAAGARLCALNLLSLMRAATGSLDAVRQVLRLEGYVRSAPGFTAQPAVLNGASELMVAVLGERGRHT